MRGETEVVAESNAEIGYMVAPVDGLIIYF